MTGPTAKQLAMMRLFHEKVDKLRRSTFADEVFTKRTGVTFTWDEKGETVELRGPSDESTEAMVLTLRFMMQNNEETGIGNMAKLYEGLPTTSVHKNCFLEARQKINDGLDRETMIHQQTVDEKTGKLVVDEKITNRRILELVIYGEKAHMNEDKARQVRALRGTPIGSALLDNQFHSSAAGFMNGLFYLQRQNAALYREFTAKELPIYERPKPLATGPKSE